MWFPDRRDGTTVAVMTDTHFGFRDWTADQLARVGRDLDYLAPHLDGFVHAGDGVHWGLDGVPHDGEMNAWLRARTLPYLLVPGNHDLSSFVPPYGVRTAADWAAAHNMAQPNTVQRIGDIVFIGIGPDEWIDGGSGYGPLVIPQHTADWLDYQVEAAAPSRVWIVAHTTMPEHKPGQFEPPASMYDTLARWNVDGWISGHRHHNIETEDTSNTVVLTYGANTLVSVNCPSVGGKTGGTEAGTPFDDTVISAVITMGDQTVVRWRDHLNLRWTRDVNNDYTRTF